MPRSTDPAVRRQWILGQFRSGRNTVEIAQALNLLEPYVERELHVALDAERAARRGAA